MIFTVLLFLAGIFVFCRLVYTLGTANEALVSIGAYDSWVNRQVIYTLLYIGWGLYRVFG